MTGKEIMDKCIELTEENNGCPEYEEAGLCPYYAKCRELRMKLREANPGDIYYLMNEVDF